MLETYLERWNLKADGKSIQTPRALLLPVRRGDDAAMLKIATEPEEQFGGRLLEWWGGEGAARVLAREGPAILIERAEGTRSLSEYARTGRDAEAAEIICDVIAKLHTPRKKPLPELVPLAAWFQDLEPGAVKYGGLLHRSCVAARQLLNSPREVVVLHGDIHHDNVLDFGERGWLAIDPKRLRGERGFDYANIFTNPDIAGTDIPVATLPERFSERLDIVLQKSGLERERLLQWIVAWTGLSAVWMIADNHSPEVDFRIAKLAIAALDG